jgi:integrase
MTRRRKEVGIRRKRSGWQAFVSVNGQFRSMQFPLETPIAEMRAWRDAQTDFVLPPATGSFAADVARYLARPEIAAMPSVKQRAAHLDLWLTALGRDRSRGSITQSEVETILQRWLAAGLAAPTVYHRRTALGSCCATLGGPNPVTGTTRPDHYRPVDRSIPYDTIEQIIAAMPSDYFLGKGIKGPSLAKLRVAVIAYTGIPPGELMKLKAHHFDRAQAILHTPWREKGAGTPAHIRELTPEGVAAFVALDAAHGWGAFAEERLATSFKRAARRVCGADTRIRLYDLRHSFGAEMYRLTRDLATVGRMLGHVPGSIVTHRYAMGAHAEVDRAAAAAFSAARRTTTLAAVPPTELPKEPKAKKPAARRLFFGRRTAAANGDTFSG